jgi:hypothetical protein
MNRQDAAIAGVAAAFAGADEELKRERGLFRL